MHLPTFALHRAFDIAMELNDAGRTDAVCEQLLTLSEQAPLKDIGIWSAPSAIFDGKQKISDAHRARMVSGLETRLASAAGVPDGYAARVASDGLLGMYRRGANTQNRERVLRTVADAYLRQSKQADPGVAIAWLQEAAALLEKEDLHQYAETLRLEMEKRGPEAISAMRSVRIEVSVPIEELNTALDELIAVQHPYVALVRLVSSLLPNCDRLRARVREMEQQFSFYRLVPRVIVGRDGIPIAGIGSSENDMDGRLMEEVRDELVICPNYFVIGLRKIKEKFGLQRKESQISRDPLR